MSDPVGWLCEEPGCTFYTEVEALAFAHCDERLHSLARCPRSRSGSRDDVVERLHALADDLARYRAAVGFEDLQRAVGMELMALATDILRTPDREPRKRPPCSKQ